MESAFFSFLMKLFVAGNISTNGLIVFVILLICSLSYYVFRPMFRDVKTLPTRQYIDEIIKRKTDTDKKCIEEMGKKLNKILEVMDQIDDIDKNSYREVKELRRDIETVKQILNQFQGHMLYGNRSSDFGNKELK